MSSNRNSSVRRTYAVVHDAEDDSNTTAAASNLRLSENPVYDDSRASTRLPDDSHDYILANSD